ncbi:MAG TPA: hypothetical protein VHV32_18860 [Candidatus Angelobacter sp.]|jgi:hypothetical protein|nr:hypothetical protein [Candidatus Angelobacter sp.]
MPKILLDQVGDLKTFHTIEDGRNFISYEQDDVEPLLDFAHAMRTEADTARASPDCFNYAHLPDSIVLDLKFKHGLDLLKRLTPTDERKLYALLETEYAKLLFTNMRLARPV